MPAPGFILALLLVVSASLATCIERRSEARDGQPKPDQMLAILLGDGRRMFANHFFTKADVYFHSGYYPSIFDQARAAVAHEHHMEADHDEAGGHAEEPGMNFLEQPHDWIERFGRHFFPTTHSHLDKPGEAREILPWLRISADLDPQRIETYVVAAYWLRVSLKKVPEAEQFLREGLRANPDSYEILYDLGSIYADDYHDPEHGLNLWELAWQRWKSQADAKKEPDPEVGNEILTHLATLEENQKDFAKSIFYKELELKLNLSPAPGPIQQQIDELRKKITTPGH